MSRKLWKRWLWTGALAAAALPAGVGLAEGDEPAAGANEPPARGIRFVLQLPPEAGSGIANVIKLVANGEAPPTSEYWIGVGLDPHLPPLLKEQLGIEHGLVVLDPFPDSPAATAGLKQHDILIKAGETLLKEPGDLIQAVEQAKATELALTLLRGGKEMTVKVTPTKRPERAREKVEAAFPGEYVPEFQNEIRRLEEALQQLKGKAGQGPLSLSFVHPPILARTTQLAQSEFPKDLRVQITKAGEGPATIKVKQGDQEWEVTEDKLDDLPAELRGHVEKLRGQPMMMRYPLATPGKAIAVPPGQAVDGKVHGAIRVHPAAPGTAAVHAYRARLHSDDNVDAKLDAILMKLDQIEDKDLEKLQTEVERLRKDLDELRGKSPAEK